MTRTCGTCLFWARQGDVGFCQGAPPTVTAVQPDGVGGWNITSHQPLLAAAARCGRHVYRGGLKGLWLKQTGWR